MSLFKLLVALQAVMGSLPALAHGDPTNWASLHCPSNSADGLPTPTYGSDQIVFTVCAELNISAPLIDVYNAILDFKAYPSWNTFVLAVDLPSNVTATPTDNYVTCPCTEVLTVLDYANAAGYSMSAWRYDDGLGGVGMRAEHPNVLVDTVVVLPSKGNLQTAFEKEGADLKAYVERS
ncbi:hypothetical protein B0H13DRAFT_2530074 [Mycena leptocephala]|nr:hypothetical protein B0H13DRAFT_2530074 [Mycena leptocephala]